MAEIDRERLPSVAELRQLLTQPTAEPPRHDQHPDGIADQRNDLVEITAKSNIAEPETLADRHQRQFDELQKRQAVESTRLVAIFNEEIAAKLNDFDALHVAASEREQRERREQQTPLLKLWTDSLRARISPAEAKRIEEREAEERAAEDARHQQEHERARNDFETKLTAERDREINDLADRHAEQARRLEAQHARERDYQREQAGFEEQNKERIAKRLEQELFVQQLARDRPDDEHTR
jgi:hypothetical protein